MATEQANLTKGQQRKLTALRKSIGDRLGGEVFSKWLKEQTKTKRTVESDPVAEKIAEALKSLEKDKSIKLGNYGYVIKRSKGKGAKGFVVHKISK